MLEYHVHFKNV